MFFYWQPSGEDPWNEQQASLRERVIAERKPRYTTVLDLDTLIVDGMTAEELAKVKYSGPLYFDWDSEDLGQATEKFQEFLGKLEKLGVDLHQIRLFATGGRGYHCEIPQECFTAKPAPRAHLPAIYKEMCYELFVDTMDLRVYTARRGRMWRTTNVERENGRYKVPISPAEAKAMTDEAYAALTAAPRPVPTLVKPTLNIELNRVWSKAVERVDQALKRKRDPKLDAALLAKFSGDFPPSLKRIMTGELQATEGYNKVALQIAITAAALGKPAADVLAACEGLFAAHHSDSGRYNSPNKRRRALAELLAYTEGNPCYAFSRGGVKSLLPQGTDTPDLDGLEEGETVVQSEPSTTTEGTDAAPLQYDPLTLGVKMTNYGVVQMTGDGSKRLCNAGFSNITRLLNSEKRLIGLEVTLAIDGDSNRSVRCQIPLEGLLSKAALVRTLAPYSVTWLGSDLQTQALLHSLQKVAKIEQDEYLVSREGLDVVDSPLSPGKLDVVWVSPFGVVASKPSEGELNPNYRFRGQTGISGVYRSDLHLAPPLEAHDKDFAEALTAAMEMNAPHVIGNLLGWMTACFHRQFHHRASGQFPLLQVYGEAGSGKTTTVEVFSHLFYYRAKPLILQAGSTTNFGVESALMNSASIPLILDEYKPRQMPPGRHGRLLAAFRSAYNAQSFAKGGMGEDPGAWRDLRVMAYSAPILFIGEAVETETATLERTITVPFDKSVTGRNGAAKDTVQDHRTAFSRLGRTLISASEVVDLDAFKARIRALEAEVRGTGIAGFASKPRVVFNVAAVIAGLEFLDSVLQQFYGDRFCDQFQTLRNATMDLQYQVGGTVMSEAAKVLHMMAMITNMEDAISNPDIGLLLGQDYHITPDGKYLDLKMRNAYIKYATWCRRKSFTPLYDDEEAFLHGMSYYGGIVTTGPLDSPLKAAEPFAKIFRFNTDHLAKDGVDPFRAK